MRDARESGTSGRTSPRVRPVLLGLLAGLMLVGCGTPGAVGPRQGEDTAEDGAVTVRIPRGAGAGAVAESLHVSGLVGHPFLFSTYVRLRGAGGELKAGTYRMPADAGWEELLSMLRRGNVATEPVTVAPGLGLREIASRVAEISGTSADSVLALAREAAVAREMGVPGPSLEGYLFPETYRFARGVSPRQILSTMTERYRRFWGPEERARADSLDLTEREVVTLASIVEKEARVAEERPVIAAVYLNRLERGMRLEADPTVQFALDSARSRLLYRDIEEVAENPYNTYTHAGLPPGPIASPGEASLRAVLHPEQVPWLFFVARPDGSHVFTRTIEEHNRAKLRIRNSTGTP